MNVRRWRGEHLSTPEPWQQTDHQFHHFIFVSEWKWRIVGMAQGRFSVVGPGEYVEDRIEGQTQRPRPLSDALKDKLDLRGPMKGFVIYFTESVEFADGSSYKDETTYKALRLYLEGNPQRRREVWSTGVQSPGFVANVNAKYNESGDVERLRSVLCSI